MSQLPSPIKIKNNDSNYFIVLVIGGFSLRVGGRPAIIVALGIPQAIFSFLAIGTADALPDWVVPTLLILSLLSFAGLAAYWIYRQQG